MKVSDDKKIMFEIYLENGQFKSRAKESSEAIGGIGKKVKEQEFSFGSLGNAAKGFIGLGIVGAFYKIGKAALSASAEMEKNKIAFTTMLGSAEKADQLLKEMTDFAQSTPFELPQIVDAGKKLLAFGFSASSIIPTLTKLGDVSAALSIPIGELSDIYGKMKVQGIIQAEELNQLAGRGIPVFSELAKVMGVNEDKVKKLGSESKITFRDLEIAFTNMTKQGSQFGGLMEAQSQSLGGKWSNFQDALGKTATIMGDSISPVAKDLLEIMTNLVSKISSDKTPDSITMTGSLIKDVNALLNGTKDHIDQISAAMGDTQAEALMNEVEAIERTSGGVSGHFDEILKDYPNLNGAAAMYTAYTSGAVKLTQEQVSNLEKLLSLGSAMSKEEQAISAIGFGMGQSYSDALTAVAEAKKKMEGTRVNSKGTGGKTNKAADWDAYYNALGQLDAAAMAKVNENRKKDLANLEVIYKEKIAKEKGHKDGLKAIEEQHAMDKLVINQNYDQKVEEARELARQQSVITDASKWQAQQQNQLAYYRASAGFASKEYQGAQMIAQAGMQLMGEKNKVLFNIGKAATIANITMSAAEAILKGFSYGPYVGIPYAVLVGTVSGLQLARVAVQKPPETPKIKSGSVSTPSFAVGVWSVPYDTMAQIHKDEMIIPKTFSDSVRSGEASVGSGSGGGIIINVQGSIVDAQNLLNIVDNAQQDKAKLMGASKYTFASAY